MSTHGSSEPDTAILETPRGRQWSRGAVGAGLAVAAGVWWFGGAPSPQTAREVVEAAGLAAPVAFVAVYMAAAVLFLPVSPLVVLAGLLFGPVAGVGLALLGNTAGAALALLVARSVGRPYARRLLHSRLEAVDERLRGRGGFAAVLLLRLVPVVPFAAINATAGLTHIPLRPFVAATALGSVPAVVAYAVFGQALADPLSWPMAAAVSLLVALIAGGAVVSHRLGLAR